MNEKCNVYDDEDLNSDGDDYGDEEERREPT